MEATENAFAELVLVGDNQYTCHWFLTYPTLAFKSPYTS